MGNNYPGRYKCQDRDGESDQRPWEHYVFARRYLYFGLAECFDVIAGGTYSVTVADANGCTGSDSILITVNANPSATIVASPGEEVCEGRRPERQQVRLPREGRFHKGRL